MLKGSKHSDETRSKMTKSYGVRKADKCSAWKGGIRPDSKGYIKEYTPDHPFAVKNYVKQHRLVYEKAFNMIIMPCQVVHHINEDKMDNSIENLKLMSRSQHINLHREMK